jgi:beta-galactosidase
MTATSKFLFGAAYYPEHRDANRWDYDLDNMAAAKVNALRVGEFAWKRFEPCDGAYDFSWMDDFAEKAQRRGIGLLMCPPMRTAPAWLVERDPSILILDSQNRRLEFGSRYTFCINHPLLREKTLALAERVARHYAGGKNIVGYHLDNEYGDEPDCHCPVCKEKWQNFLRERYGRIEELNRRWGTVFWGLEFDDFSQVPTPMHTKTCHNPALIQAWRQFRSDCTVEMIGLHAEAVRRNSPGKTVTTNYQNLWITKTDYYDAAGKLDLCGTNYYPPYGPRCREQAFGLATCRSFRQAPFHVFELRCGPHSMAAADGNTPGPGELERLTMHAVGNGADGIYYFRWRSCPFGAEMTHGAITDFDGRPRSVYTECKTLGEKLQRLAPEILGTTVASDVAILYDFPTRWMMESYSIWDGPPEVFLRACKTIYSAVRGLGLNCDAVGRRQDFSAYKALFVPGLGGVDDALAEKLEKYVLSGGTLVFLPQSGMRDADANIFPTRLHPRLEKLLGVRIIDFATAADSEARGFTWRQKRYTSRMWFELPILQDSTKTAEYVDAWYAGNAAVVERAAGKGKSLYLGTYPDEEFYVDLCASWIKDERLRPILDTKIPKEVEIVERRGSDGRRLIFLMNCSDVPQNISLKGEFNDVWSQETLRSQATLKPHGVRVLLVKK